MAIRIPLGVGDPDGLGWVGRVVAASFDAGKPLTAYNLGVRRDTSEHVLHRWPAETRARVTSETACKVVFAFGANDTTVEDGDLRVPSNRSRDALGALLEQADKLGLRAFVVGPAPVDDEEQNERIAALSNSFSALCADCNVPFVDVVGTLRRHSSAWRREVVEGDGAHPGAGGYEELAGLVIDGGWMDWVER